MEVSKVHRERRVLRISLNLNSVQTLRKVASVTSLYFQIKNCGTFKNSYNPFHNPIPCDYPLGHYPDIKIPIFNKKINLDQNQSQPLG